MKARMFCGCPKSNYLIHKRKRLTDHRKKRGGATKCFWYVSHLYSTDYRILD